MTINKKKKKRKEKKQPNKIISHCKICSPAAGKKRAATRGTSNED